MGVTPFSISNVQFSLSKIQSAKYHSRFINGNHQKIELSLANWLRCFALLIIGQTIVPMYVNLSSSHPQTAPHLRLVLHADQLVLLGQRVFQVDDHLRVFTALLVYLSQLLLLGQQFLLQAE